MNHTFALETVERQHAEIARESEVGYQPLVVAAKIREADDTYSLRLHVPDDAAETFRYRPGQFVHIHRVVDGQSFERSYSLSSTSGVDAFFQITVKRIEGGVLSPIIADDIGPGDELHVSFPQGRFFEHPAEEPRHFLLFGAGSGVTPLFSILKWILARDQGDKVTLFFASRRESAIIFRSELEKLETDHPGRVRTVHVLTQPSATWRGERGRMDQTRLASLLANYVGDQDLREIAYLCGPVPFMDEITAALEARGLERRDIHRESFTVAEAMSSADLNDALTVRIEPEAAGGPPDRCESLTVRIDGKDEDIALEPDETILAGILRQGLDAPFSCQEGTCLSCMCRVEEGAVRMKRHELIGLTEDDLGKGIALACLSRPDARRVRLSFEDV